MQKFGCISLALFMLGTVPAVADDDRVVFKGEKVEVTYADIERYLIENTPPDPVERQEMLSKPDMYKRMAESLYTVRALAEEAERAPGFDKAQALWTAEILYRRRIASDYRYTYVEHVLKDVNWQATARDAYQAQKDLYKTDEKVNASHILITTENRSEEEAQALAAQLRARALKGEEFGALAKQYSDDPSAERNAGNLGFFKHGQMVKPFEAVVFKMREAGAVSEVVKSPFGYHVIQFHSRQEAKQLPFEKVEKQIVEELKAQMSKKVWQDKLIAIRSSADIVIDKVLLLELQQEQQRQMKVK